MNVKPGGNRLTRTIAVLGFGIAACVGLLGASQQAIAGAPTHLPSGATNASAQAQSKLYGVLGQSIEKATNTSDRMRVIVHMKNQVDLSTWPLNDRPGAIWKLRDLAGRDQASVRGMLATAAMDANITESYWIFNGFAMEAPISTIQAVAQRDDVAYIIEDGEMTAPKLPTVDSGIDNPASNWNIYQVNAPQTWALGYDGTGRTLANQDSGVDGTHEALATRWRGLQPGHSAADSWLDPFGISPNFPSPTGAHGTHTMGTIAGYQGDPTGPNEIGQAKGADWIACRIYDDSGKGPFRFIHACFQFMADPDGNPNTNDQPDAVGNSWGDLQSYSYPDTEWMPDIAAWVAVGVYPVFSNGNDGPGVSTVGKPGAYPNVIGVGAVTQGRQIAGFSSHGPAPDLPPWNNPDNWERSDWNLIKPEVVAPGVNVRSSVPTGNAYALFSGTSMASPHVTGLAGLLRQIRPNLTFNEYYNIIIDTAYFSPTWGTRPNNTYGWGEIDDYAAAIYVRDAGTVSTTLTDASCGTTVVGAKIWVYDNTAGSRAQGVGIRKGVSDNNGHFSTILAAGTYSVTISAPGYYGTTVATTVMSGTTNTLPINLAKMATGTVTGNVTDGSNGISGATVSVYGLPGITATTDSSGNYTLSNVPAGTFTIQVEDCGYTSVSATVTVNYTGTVTQDFVLPAPTSLITDDFESGNLNNWTVTGGSATTAIWHNSTIRASSGTHAARAGVPAQPVYTGTADTYMTSNAFDTTAADNVWLSFNLYDSSESEYDVIKVQVSTAVTPTWTQAGTIYGEASPIDGWQSICLNLNAWRSSTMRIRFFFHADGNNWSNEVFEGPSVDDVRLTASMPSGTPTDTPVPAMTPTAGATIPCTPVSGTPTATPTECAITFTDVSPSDYFYIPVQYLYCHGAISGYGDNTFRPSNNTTRGQVSKIVVLAEGWEIYIPTTPTFTDVPTDHPFYQYIETAYSHGIISGYADGTFKPGNNVTRGQLCKIVVLAEGWTLYNPPTPTFDDVPTDHPFYQYVETAYAHGIISGYGTVFLPGNSATRGQISKIVYNAVTAP